MVRVEVLKFNCHKANYFFNPFDASTFESQSTIFLLVIEKISTNKRKS